MSREFPLTRAPSSRLGEVDFENLGFGTVFSDHMFSMEYRDGQWTDAQIIRKNAASSVTSSPSSKTRVVRFVDLILPLK